ncbi:disease resistance protein RPV1 [Pyrus x bretschneideri]|uniref:disease resistance protein RPV1 n=1 Tax=Pyrus x bretschneideri TaxID=225117 RepID=UPI00202F77D3|nr:disease resistance protein RPV1 [Pyrus x bretschneideri]
MASSSFCSESSSSSGRRSWKYDVFLNFRGEDTRRSFVCHLYRALDQKAIHTFIDAEELRKGNHLSDLLTAIQNSRVSIVVFSPNYASSTWCLKELVQILECMDSDGQTVVPVFYDVDPSDVRKRKRSFAEAFARHELDSAAEMAEVRRWKSALTKACNISGWDSRNYEDDARLIAEIVQDIFDKLTHMSSSEGEGLVGMDSQLDEMNLQLCLGTEDVRFVGIWGMGGIGKTTIAKAVYDKIACQFEAYCFLENVKEGFSRHGAIHMQEELLSRILKERVPSLGTLDKGSKMIRERLAKKKVFLVLDDVDNIDQIEGLLGKQRSFGCGSRIIITTRDEQLLRLSRVDAIYRPKFLSDNEARDLFMQYAFRTNQPTSDYNHLTCHAIEYAKGLPLALKVLGGFLDNKSVREWEDVLEKIRKIPHMGIQDVLRTSFYGLDDSEKDIFLDIACFFKGMKKDRATNILEGCGFYPHSGLRVLINRSLITISDYGTLEMHDLLEEMGWEIVRQESIKEPGRRSRLWSYEDVHPVFTQNTATEAIESIVLDLSNKSEEVYLNAEAFVGMTRLRLLRIQYHNPSRRVFIRCPSRDFPSHKQRLSGDFPSHKQHLSGDFKYLSHELRYLVWHGCPLKSLPSNFNPNNLVDLDIQFSNIQQLWEGTKHLKSLKFINLNLSQYLERTPDLTEAKNLEALYLENCKSLFEVHPSISSLQNLLVLSLRGCKKLRKFPSSIDMRSLKSLNLSGCSKFEKFPEISNVMKELSKLCLDGTAIKELPSSIKNLTGLVTLNLKDCIELQSLPSSIYMRSLKSLNLSGCSKFEKFPEILDVMKELSELHLDGTAIKELPSSIKNLTGLVTLNLKNCIELQSLPSSIYMRSLKSLNLSGCSKFEKFPEILDVMKELSELHLDGTAIKELPSSIKNLTGLVTLNLKNCIELQSLPSSIYMRFLKSLNLSGCSKFEKFPEISDVMKELSELHLDGTAIKELPSSIKNLTGLVTLNIKECIELQGLPSSIYQLKSLKDVTLCGCKSLKMFLENLEVSKNLSKLCLDGIAIRDLPFSIKNLTGLHTFNLRGCLQLKSLPSSICQLKSLRWFSLSGCSNLEKFPEILEVMEELRLLCLDGTAIEELPSSINNLTGLRSLRLKGCLKLKSLPCSICQLKSLKDFTLSGCSNLEKFPEILEVMEELRSLCLDETAIEELPSSINNLTELRSLSLKGCLKLKSLPCSICQLRSLKNFTLSGCSNLEKFPEILEVMKELQWLCLDGTAIEELPSSINNLAGLRSLSLKGCLKLESLPCSICQLRSLKDFTLSGCSNLEKFPEILEVMEELRSLCLDETAIEELPSSINNLTELRSLSLKGCLKLKSLPCSICQLRFLKDFTLSGCSNLEKFPEILEVMEELRSLCLDETAIEELPSSINNLTGLRGLSLEGCLKLKSLPCSICFKSLKYFTLSGCTNLEKFPEILEVMEELRSLCLDETAIEELPLSINNLTGLHSLSLKGCLKLKSLPCSICQLKSLKDFTLSGCSNLEKFPEILEVMEELQSLCLDETAIEELPSSINNLTGLRSLSLEGCLELISLPCSICHLKSLGWFSLSGSKNLEKFPEILEVMGELNSLCLDKTAIEELPLSINNLTGLCSLSLEGCLKLKSLPCSICQLKSLRWFSLSGSKNLEKFPEILEVMGELKWLCLDETAIEELPSSINNLTGLRSLSLKCCLKLKSLPCSICQLKSLKDFTLSGCSNLEKFPEILEVMKELQWLCLDGTAIEELPSSINNLTGLWSLSLDDCLKLKSLPCSIDQLKSLIYIFRSDCPNLETENLPN